MRIAFDIKLMRPGCALVAAALGVSVEAANRFNIEDWLLYPTPNMGVYETTEAQLETLVIRARNLTPA